VAKRAKPTSRERRKQARAVAVAYGFAEPPQITEERRKPHPHYPEGVPEPQDRSLLGFYNSDTGMVVVRECARGYEVHTYLCGVCPACEVGDLWNCPVKGATLDVAGDRPEIVRAYLDQFGTHPRRKIKSRQLGER
jgi:hypothetical protein